MEIGEKRRPCTFGALESRNFMLKRNLRAAATGVAQPFPFQRASVNIELMVKMQQSWPLVRMHSD